VVVGGVGGSRPELRRGFITVLDAATGEPVGPPLEQDLMPRIGLLTGEDLVLAADRRVRVVRVTDGRVRWEHREADAITHAQAAGPVLAIRTQGSATRLLRLDVGEVIFGMPGQPDAPSPAAVPAGRGVLVSTGDRLHRLDADGRRVWTTTPRAHPAPPTRTHPTHAGLYILEHRPDRLIVHRIDPASGAVRELAVLPPHLVDSRVSVSSAGLAVAGDGVVHVVHAAPTDRSP
jgi:hypothetical protein